MEGIIHTVAPRRGAFSSTGLSYRLPFFPCLARKIVRGLRRPEPTEERIRCCQISCQSSKLCLLIVYPVLCFSCSKANTIDNSKEQVGVNRFLHTIHHKLMFSIRSKPRPFDSDNMYSIEDCPFRSVEGITLLGTDMFLYIS